MEIIIDNHDVTNLVVNGYAVGILTLACRVGLERSKTSYWAYNNGQSIIADLLARTYKLKTPQDGVPCPSYCVTFKQIILLTRTDNISRK